MDKRNGAILRRANGYYTTSEVAEILGVNRYTFHDWIDEGKVPRPCVRTTGKRRYFTVKIVEELKRQILGKRSGSN